MATPSSSNIRINHPDLYSHPSIRMTVSEANNHNLKDKTHGQIVTFFANINLRGDVCLNCINSINFSDWDAQKVIEFLGSIDEVFLPNPLECLKTINFKNWNEEQVELIFEKKYKRFLPSNLENVATINFTPFKTKTIKQFIQKGRLSYSKYIDCSNWEKPFLDHLFREIPTEVLSLNFDKIKIENWSAIDRKKFLLSYYTQLHSPHVVKKYFPIVASELSSSQIRDLNFDPLNEEQIHIILHSLTDTQKEFLSLKTIEKNLSKMRGRVISFLGTTTLLQIKTSLFSKQQLIDLGVSFFPWEKIREINALFFDKEFFLKFFNDCWLASSKLVESQLKRLNAKDFTSEQLKNLSKEQIKQMIGDCSLVLNTNNYLRAIPDIVFNKLTFKFLASINFDHLDESTINRLLTVLLPAALLNLNIQSLLRNAVKINPPLLMKIIKIFYLAGQSIKLDVEYCTSRHFACLRAEHFIPKSLNKLTLRDLGDRDNIDRFFKGCQDLTIHLSPELWKSILELGVMEEVI